ncbi:MAG: PIG-L deacetylase family protein [Phycisphaerales bacterium JB063]
MIEAGFKPLRSVLCLGAHADDIEIGCGGTLLKLIEQHPGLAVHWVVFSADEMRAVEARQSAADYLKHAGEYTLTLHGFRDSLFPYDAEAIKGVFNNLSQSLTPDLIFAHRPDDAHQDHRVLSEMTWCAFRNHAILEYEIPKYEGDLGRPNLLVTLSPEQARRKVGHLMTAFPSQREKPWYTEDTFYALMRLRGLECHSPSRFAEGFHARKLVM